MQCTVVGVSVCESVCVGVRDSVGVAHSTGRLCGKHCMHTKDRWKGKGGWAGSEQQKKCTIWFIRLGRSDGGEEGRMEKEEKKWQRQREWWRERKRTMTERDKCTSGRELAVNNEKAVTALCTWYNKTTAPVETNADTLRTPLTVSPPHSRKGAPSHG